MGYAVSERKHSFGYFKNFEVSQQEFVTLDVQDDQYSVNWTTRLDAPAFLENWHPGVDKARAVVHPASAEAEPFSGLGYELYLQGWGSYPFGLVRFWLDDCSVAWQLFSQAGGDTVALAGIASNIFDPEGLSRYALATATQSIENLWPTVLEEISPRLYKLSNAHIFSLDSIEFRTEGH